MTEKENGLRVTSGKTRTEERADLQTFSVPANNLEKTGEMRTEPRLSSPADSDNVRVLRGLQDRSGGFTRYCNPAYKLLYSIYSSQAAQPETGPAAVQLYHRR